MFLQRMPGAPPLPDITGKELVYVLPVLPDLTPGPNLASVTVDQLGAFAGAAALPPPPPGIPTTPPSNYFLDSAGQWKVPGTNWVWFGSQGDYTMLPTDDVVEFSYITSNSSITVPDPYAAPWGKTFKLIIHRMAPGISFTITGRTQFLVISSGQFTFWGQNSWRIGPSTREMALQFVATNTGSSGRWQFVNHSEALSDFWALPSTQFQLPGLSPPPPPAGYAYVTSDYTLQTTDDVVRLIFASGQTITLTIPPATNFLNGKSVKFHIGMADTCTFILSGAIFFQRTTGLYTLNGGSFTVSTGAAGNFLIFELWNLGSWFLVTEGVPFTGVPGAFLPNPYTTIGHLPGPPPGTPATAVLHADMTWY